MIDITSNITFDNDNGKITKCVLKITGGKTFTVTLGIKGYEVKEGGTDPCSTPTPENTPAPANPAPAANAANPGANPAANTVTPSAPPAPLEQEKYNTQVELIEKLVQRGYTAPQ